MILVTKNNVTSAMLESICNGDISVGSSSFLLQTPLGISEFILTSTTNTHGRFMHKRGMLVLRAQGPYLAFSDKLDTLLHGDVTELVDYIKSTNYVVVTV